MTNRLTSAEVAEFRHSPEFSALLERFRSWPEASRMSAESRATLYWLIQRTRPQTVAEIGTLFAGTAEVIARALIENGLNGMFHTTDFYGAERCPPIIASWPDELRAITTFYPLDSMAFFSELVSRRIGLDLVLVDGNHDFEYALFDLQMTARVLRPGGLVIMDNAEQTGPFYASKLFVDRNPTWQELGNAIVNQDPRRPFDAARTSVPGTTFLLLQAPSTLTVSLDPHSWGPQRLDVAFASGLHLDLPAQKTSGVLRYQAILRSISHIGRRGQELFDVGEIRIDVDGEAKDVIHRFPVPLKTDLHERFEDAARLWEVDMSWVADPGAPPLALKALPTPYGGD